MNLPPHLKYDIGTLPPDVESVPSLESDRSPQRRLSIKAEDDPSLNIPSDASRLTALTKSLSTLTTHLPHTTLASVSAENMLPSDLESDEPTGYYSPSHEASHLAVLDYSLGLGPCPNVEAPKPASLMLRINDKEKERHKQQELNNPVSAYNWLRKNQPQVFLQDSEKEKDGEKSVVKEVVKKEGAPKASPKPKAARRSAVKKEKEEVEVVYDDEGYPIGGPSLDEVQPPGTGRGKRKRQGDEAYRPKGGSSRANKRKKRVSGEKDRGSGTPATNEEGS